MTEAAQQATSAAGVAWNLTDLYQSVDDPQLSRDLEAALRRAQAFEAAYRGKLHVDGGPRAELLLGAIAQERGQAGMAKQHYKKYLELEPNGEHAAETRKLLTRLGG